MTRTFALFLFFFFFNDTATTEIYTLSLHDALPIYPGHLRALRRRGTGRGHPGLEGDEHTMRAHPPGRRVAPRAAADRKSTRLNSSHANISYAVFCLKKKKNISKNTDKFFYYPICSY